MLPRYIEVKRTSWSGTIYYTVVGGPENGRTLTLDEYTRYIDAGVPVVRV